MIIIKNKKATKILHTLDGGAVNYENYNYMGLVELGGDFEIFFEYTSDTSILKPEIRKWCDININYHYEDNKVMIFFKNHDDVVAFKMMWL